MWQQLLDTSFHTKGRCKGNKYFHSFLAEFFALNLHTSPKFWNRKYQKFYFQKHLCRITLLLSSDMSSLIMNDKLPDFKLLFSPNTAETQHVYKT